jgi:hypothetical protein
MVSAGSGSSTPEWLALLECARPGRDPAKLREFLQRPVQWPTLQSLAEEHGMMPLLAVRILECGQAAAPQEVLERLRQRQRQQVVFTLSLTAELFRLLDRLVASGVDAMVIKGPALSLRSYGDPAMRQYGDLDLIVRDTGIQRTTEIMVSFGYTPKIPLQAARAKKKPGEYAFQHPSSKVLVEFHTEHTFRYYPRPLDIEKLFARRAFVAFDDREVPALAVEDELILICIHGAKHFWQRLLWIADVAALVCSQPLDWKRIPSCAKEVGAQRMLNLGLRLASDVLGAKLPTEIAEIVNSDSGAVRLAAQITSRLPVGDAAPGWLWPRAAFRVAMCGNVFEGAAYLLRLSLSPTEEDWSVADEKKRPSLRDALSRPLRLARKYGRASRQ